jgi:hypothetical protein
MICFRSIIVLIYHMYFPRRRAEFISKLRLFSFPSFLRDEKGSDRYRYHISELHISFRFSILLLQSLQRRRQTEFERALICVSFSFFSFFSSSARGRTRTLSSGRVAGGGGGAVIRAERRGQVVQAQ